MDGLQVGNEALKKANAMFSIEEIEQIMGDTAEAIEKQQEIDALLSGQLSTEDEDEVLEELDQLCNLEAEDSSENVTPQQLPDVPTEGEIFFCNKVHQSDFFFIYTVCENHPKMSHLNYFSFWTFFRAKKNYEKNLIFSLQKEKKIILKKIGKKISIKKKYEKNYEKK